MPSLNIGQQGHTPGGVGDASGALKSTPKITRINGDDFLPIVYRNMGNNHAYPFIWAESRTMGPGTWTVLSGIKFHGMPVSEYGMVTVGGSDGVAPYVTKDTDLNMVSVTTAASGTVDIIVMMGSPTPDLASFACRGNTGARQMLP